MPAAAPRSRSYKEDYQTGKDAEDENLPIIKRFFEDESITKSPKRYDKYDYKGCDDCYYELKCRTVAFSKYPTTLIRKDKVFADKHVFLFKFTDGLYFVRYSKELFDSFKCDYFSRFARFGTYDKPALYYFIPTEHLTRLE